MKESRESTLWVPSPFIWKKSTKTNKIEMTNVNGEIQPEHPSTSRLPKKTSFFFKSSHRLLLLAIIGMTLYLLLGAVAFSSIEMDREISRKSAIISNLQNLSDFAVEKILTKIKDHNCEEGLPGINNCLETIKRSAIDDEITVLVNELLLQLGVNSFRMNSSNSDIIVNWDIAGAFYFCLTTVTTIGYGNFAPTTDGSRLLTVAYALVGIPGFLYLCAQVSSYFEILFSKLRNFCHADKSSFRLRLYYLYCMCIVTSLLLVHPLLATMLIQKLDFVTSVYFIVISLSTVGYGDIYPIDPTEYNDSYWFRFIYCVVMWTYIIIGLSLFANFLSLIQSWIGKAVKVKPEETSNQGKS